MNNIRGKNIYHGVIDSYIKVPSSSKIKGTLLEIDENKIKVGIGSERALDITLNKPMEAQVGEDIVIDRRNIVDSRLVKQTDEVLEEEQAVQDFQSKYDYILESLDIPINDESIEAVKSLESYGIDITKENILSFMLAKEQLSDIGEKLDYDIAVKLIEKDINFEKESLQKVLQEVQKVQGEKRPFSFLRFLGIKKDMSTEEAEKIAYKIYGDKTGKDVTDIIKALDKAGLDTSKKNIEAINNVFSKLHNIKDIENRTIIDSVKNKIETSIDNLYKLKNAIVGGVIEAEQKLGQLASRVYGTYSGAVGIITEKELTQIEGDIKDRLQYMEIKVTDEIVKLSKDVISRGLDLTKENLQKIMTVKGAVIELNSGLDYEKTALLMASGVEVEKVDVVELRDMIDIEYSIENTEHDIEHASSRHSPEQIPVEHGMEHIIAEHSTEHISMENIEHIPVEHDTGHVTAKPDIWHIPTERGTTLGLDRLEILEPVENISVRNENTEQDKIDKNILTDAKRTEEIADKMRNMVDMLKHIPPEEKNTIISLLMKNAMPLTLKEVQNLSFFLGNQRQIGHQLDEILNLIDKNENMEIIKITKELKQVVNKINKNIKEGKQIGEEPYKEVVSLLKELENKSPFLTKEDKGILQKNGERLLDSLELQLQLNREDMVLQLPLIMNEHLKNLQIYIMKDKKGGKKIDPQNMSILLNFDTNNMGNVNIYVAVNYKNIVMKMGLASKEDQNLIEKYSNELGKHLESLGYNLKDLSFRISGDNHILSMVGETGERELKIKRLLDVRI